MGAEKYLRRHCKETPIWTPSHSRCILRAKGRLLDWHHWQVLHLLSTGTLLLWHHWRVLRLLSRGLLLCHHCRVLHLPR